MNQPANNLLCFDDQISCFTLSPYDWSHNLCAIGQPSKIILGTFKLPVSRVLVVFVEPPLIRAFLISGRVGERLL